MRLLPALARLLGRAEAPACNMATAISDGTITSASSSASSCGMHGEVRAWVPSRMCAGVPGPHAPGLQAPARSGLSGGGGTGRSAASQHRVLGAHGVGAHVGGAGVVLRG